MPTISMFYGILVAMYVLDTDKHHHPHIHIRYNEFKAVLKIPAGEVLEELKGSGSLNSAKMAASNSWSATHAHDQHVLRNSGGDA